MKRAGPFDHLLGMQRELLPKSASVAVVVDGKRIDDVRQIDPDDRRSYERQVRRAKDAARYQRDRQQPEKMATRQAWLERNREKVREWKRVYDQQNKVRQRGQKAAYQRRKYASDPEACRAATRAYYERHREEILAKKKAQRDAKKAAAAAGSADLGGR